MARAGVSLAVCRVDPAEVASERFERHALGFDLAGGAIAKTPQDGHGRAPALQSMLEQECANKSGQDEPTLPHGGGQEGPSKGHGGGVRLKSALDIPLLIKLAKAPVDAGRMVRKETGRARSAHVGCAD